MPHPIVSPLPDAQPAPAATPPADVLDSDRILELPARRQPPAANTYTQRAPRMNNSRPRISTGMQSLREATARISGGHATAAHVRCRIHAVRRRDEHAERRAGEAAPCGRMSARSATARAMCGWMCRSATRPLGRRCAASAKSGRSPTATVAHLRRLSNLDPFRDKTFEKFDVAMPGVREAFDVAQHYAEDPMGWLVFGGGYGTRQDHLAAAVANACEQAGVPVIFAIVPDLLDHLRAAFAPNSETTYDALFDKIREVQLARAGRPRRGEQHRLGDGEALPTDQLSLQLPHANGHHDEPSPALTYG